MLHALENIVGIFGCFLLIKKLTQELLQHLIMVDMKLIQPSEWLAGNYSMKELCLGVLGVFCPIIFMELMDL